MEPQVEELTDVSPNIGAAYEITVFDKDGNVKQVIKDDAKCFVQNFLRLVRYWFVNANNVGDVGAPSGFKNLSGSVVQTTSALPPYNTIQFGSWLTNAGVGDLTRGIVAGSGSVAVTDDDYKLGSIITNGSGSGQLSYDSTVFNPVSIVGNTVTLTQMRMTSNFTVNPIVISEIGLYMLGIITIMTIRDILVPSITLGAGESALIAYKIIING